MFGANSFQLQWNPFEKGFDVQENKQKSETVFPFVKILEKTWKGTHKPWTRFVTTGVYFTAPAFWCHVKMTYMLLFLPPLTLA